MSTELMYWIIFIILSTIPFLLGIWLMKRTQQLSKSFWIPVAISGVLTFVSCYWWWLMNEDAFTIRLGIFFYVIAWVNVTVILIFALLSIRKIPDSSNSETRKDHLE
jgi:hypothetical protein